MTAPHEKLAESLEALHALQAAGRIAIRSQDLSRTDRERLMRSGFLQEVIKGHVVMFAIDILSSKQLFCGYMPRSPQPTH